MARAEGIEPPSTGLEAVVLPLDEARKRSRGVRICTYHCPKRRKRFLDKGKTKLGSRP